ncbi:hypothetical protein ANN_10268 [Periplaneta americana]|uniref:Protein takeout n=1 Tax=Periplaneta americana TaxID=6978 RepID=A0ABQ8TNJ6_PERAM|nr:hypothetical protein ANN_10268 [Periplaneta americana]
MHFQLDFTDCASRYDFKKKHIFHQVIIPRVDNVGKYEIQGRLLLLPIFGQGDFNITLDNCRITYDADFIYETIDGKEYFSERNQATTITPTNVHIEFTNLFNGDKLLGKQMNEFLNKNWREWYKELSPTIFSAYSQIISTVFKGLYQTVPVSEMFPETVHS